VHCAVASPLVYRLIRFGDPRACGRTPLRGAVGFVVGCVVLVASLLAVQFMATSTATAQQPAAGATGVSDPAVTHAAVAGVAQSEIAQGIAQGGVAQGGVAQIDVAQGEVAQGDGGTGVNEGTERRTVQRQTISRVDGVVIALYSIAGVLAVMLGVFIWHTSPRRRFRLARERAGAFNGDGSPGPPVTPPADPDDSGGSSTGPPSDPDDSGASSTGLPGDPADSGGMSEAASASDTGDGSGDDTGGVQVPV